MKKKTQKNKKVNLTYCYSLDGKCFYGDYDSEDAASLECIINHSYVDKFWIAEKKTTGNEATFYNVLEYIQSP
jgi:hypothetical protein